MEVDHKDSLGNVTDNTLQQESCTSRPIPSGRDVLNHVSPIPSGKSEIDIKLNVLQKILESDVKAADIKWCLFEAAAQSYRFDSCLKPFPPQYLHGLDRDIDRLREVISKVPALPLLLQQLVGNDSNPVKSEIIYLMYWILSEQEPKLTSIPKDELETILELAPSNMPVHKPNFIFQVASTGGERSESRWDHMVAKYGTLYAYHGSRLENFHSILRYGLQQHLNKNGLFGAGIYLSSELGVSLPYSSTGCAWSGSVLGCQMSCVALCEVIDHPDVKCQQPGGTDEGARSRALSKDSLGGEVPEKYLLVRNSDLVRVRYLLVYSKHQARHNREQLVDRNYGALGWLRQYKTVLIISAYVLLLVAIGIGSSPSAQRALRLTMRKLGL